MINSMFKILVSLLLVSASAPSYAASNLWLFSLSYENDKPFIEQARKITDTRAYTNQPHFFDGGQRLYYTQSFSAGKASQTDIMTYNLVNHYHRNITYTADSEYSPTPLPHGSGFSTVRVDDNGKQWLWIYDEGQGHKFSEAEPVGYYVWMNRDEALAFVLGKPHTLQKISTDTKPLVLDRNIGPSLWPIPETGLYSYTKNPDPASQPWTLMSFDPKTQQSSLLVTLPDDAYYMAWTPGAKAITAVGNEILAWDFREPVVAEMTDSDILRPQPSEDANTPLWRSWLDISRYCQHGASRLHMSAKGTHLAVVCNDTPQ